MNNRALQLSITGNGVAERRKLGTFNATCAAGLHGLDQRIRDGEHLRIGNSGAVVEARNNSAKRQFDGGVHFISPADLDNRRMTEAGGESIAPGGGH